MDLSEMIYKRKSCRSYTGVPVSDKIISQIEGFCGTVKSLYDGIRVKFDLVAREQVRCFLPWTTPQLIAVFSEKKQGWLENAGFMAQQLDLYLQKLGLGVCWLGMGKLGSTASAEIRETGMEFVILLAFGEPKGSPWREVSGFKRKSLDEIADKHDIRLEAARLAPSSVNCQPWYFVHNANGFHVYCKGQGLIPTKMLSSMNRIDIGIALCHMYISNPDSFNYYISNSAPEVKGHRYIGSFDI